MTRKSAERIEARIGTRIDEPMQKKEIKITLSRLANTHSHV